MWGEIVMPLKRKRCYYTHFYSAKTAVIYDADTVSAVANSHHTLSGNSIGPVTN